MSKYPIIKIPIELLDAKKARIPIPPAPPAPPKPKRKLPTRAFIVIFSVLALVLIFVALSNKSSSSLLKFVSWQNIDGKMYAMGVHSWQLLLAAIPLLLYLFYLISNNESKNKFKSLYNSYLMEYEQYKIELEKYLIHIKNINNDKDLRLYRDKIMKGYFELTVKPDKLKRDVNKGRFEDNFFYELKNHFGTKISNNLQLGYFENPFVPDFVYFDSEKNIYIDIEIDEPYILNSGEPIHYIGKDDFRDAFFNENHWIVIRFSESQIAENANDCCVQIEKVISHIVSNDNLAICIKEENMWSEEQAKEMWKNNYRTNINFGYGQK